MLDGLTVIQWDLGDLTEKALLWPRAGDFAAAGEPLIDELVKVACVCGDAPSIVPVANGLGLFEGLPKSKAFSMPLSLKLNVPSIDEGSIVPSKARKSFSFPFTKFSGFQSASALRSNPSVIITSPLVMPVFVEEELPVLLEDEESDAESWNDALRDSGVAPAGCAELCGFGARSALGSPVLDASKDWRASESVLMKSMKGKGEPPRPSSESNRSYSVLKTVEEDIPGSAIRGLVVPLPGIGMTSKGQF